LLQQLAIDSEGAGLLRCQRTAKLPSDLLQLISVKLTKLVDRNLRVPERGLRRLTESPENVGNAPHPETDDQDAHHHGHYGLAEPV
jgi:hypothetical protein